MKSAQPVSSDGEFRLLAIAAIFCAVCGAIVFFRGFLDLKKRRLIENTPTSKIRGAALGLVEIFGEACGPYSLTAPLTLAPCYFYRLVIKRRVKDTWRVVEAKQRCIPFYLKDETGMMLVDATQAVTQLPKYETGYTDARQPDPYEPVPVPSMYSFRMSASFQDLSSETVAEEQCICEGQQLYAMGVLSENTSIRVEDPGPSLPLVEGPVQEQILEAALKEAAARPASALERYDLQPKTVLCGSAERPLFLSAHSQRELVSELATSSALKILGGPAMALCALTYLLWYMSR